MYIRHYSMDPQLVAMTAVDLCCSEVGKLWPCHGHHWCLWCDWERDILETCSRYSTVKLHYNWLESMPPTVSIFTARHWQLWLHIETLLSMSSGDIYDVIKTRGCSSHFSLYSLWYPHWRKSVPEALVQSLLSLAHRTGSAPSASKELGDNESSLASNDSTQYSVTDFNWINTQ